MVKNIPTPDMTVREILERWPAAAEVLARRGLDLCCGGVHPLEMAARAHGVKLEDVMAELLAALAKEARP